MYLRDTSDSITRVGPHTPMGDVLRRFWVPALLEPELPQPGHDPVELRLFGEDLVAKCVAPGRIDVTERHSQEMSPYPAVASGGIVWVYLGPQDFTPQLPVFEWLSSPPLHRSTSNHIETCTWAYAVEQSLTGERRPFFLPPFYTSPSADRAHAYVPIDDTHTLVWSFGANAQAGSEASAPPLDAAAIWDFHHRMIAMAREVARGHVPEAASHGEWYALKPFPD